MAKGVTLTYRPRMRGYSNLPPGGSEWPGPDLPADWPERKVKDWLLDRWVDRTVYDPPQMKKELGILSPKELENIRRMEKKQADEMYKRYRNNR